MAALLEVCNESGENLREVELIVAFAGELLFLGRPDPVALPSRPRRWGPRPFVPLSTRSMFDAAGVRTVDLFPDFSVNGEDPSTVTYRAVSLRPRERLILPGVPLLADAAATALEGRWRATSTSVGGVAVGEIAIAIGQPLLPVHAVPIRADRG